jgi:hypothetical protein
MTQFGHESQEGLNPFFREIVLQRAEVNVMITILGDFCQFSAKKWRFSQKQML